ncbi:MAG: DEAD/DEAH box helicase [Chlamydiia bacterium]|nr:DEAD/DEAH box helicase [Chlamydiia bacterium]
MKFSNFSLDPFVLEALASIGYETPTPVQEVAIPMILNGHDVIALAQTGSGKTAACAIPICHRVDPHNKAIQALIIVPTRELALQYAVETQKIGKKKGVRTYALFGGEEHQLQQAKLKHGVQVLVATPGRLIDLVYSRSIDLTEVDTLILDEADEMLGMGFYDDLEFIIQCLVHEHQTLLFSATMPQEIRRIARINMKEPKEISLIAKKPAPEKIEHFFSFCLHSKERLSLLITHIKTFRPKQAIIFCNSRREVEEVARELKKSFSYVDFLHGGLSQSTRTVITDKFRRARIHVLVATDVAARGLDFVGVTHVFHFHLPHDVEGYVHRSGRTGRSGRSGVSISICTHRDLGYMDGIQKKIGKKVKWIGPPPPDHNSRRFKRPRSLE